MTVKHLFSGARFIGEAEGERRTYYVFQGESGYLVATPQSPGTIPSRSSRMKPQR